MELWYHAMNTKINLDSIKNVFKKKTPDANANEYKPFAPTLPVVNVIPKTVNDRYDKEKIIKKFGLGALGLIFLFVLIWGGNLAVSSIQKTLNANVSTEIAELQKEVGAVQGYQIYQEGLQKILTNMDGVFGKSIDMNTATKQFYNAATANNITVSTATFSGSSCAPIAPYVGCVEMAVSSPNKDNILSFIKAIGSSEYFSREGQNEFTFDVGSGGTSNTTIKGTIYLTDKNYSQRYLFLKNNIVDIIKSGGLKASNISSLSGGTASPSASPSPKTNATPSASATPKATTASLDPQFATCAEAVKSGFGPYKKGIDMEYTWYEKEDTKATGIVCEAN